MTKFIGAEDQGTRQPLTPEMLGTRDSSTLLNTKLALLSSLYIFKLSLHLAR